MQWCGCKILAGQDRLDLLWSQVAKIQSVVLTLFIPTVRSCFDCSALRCPGFLTALVLSYYCYFCHRSTW